eukprot:5776856-Prymnesium_polylepis.1
MGSAPPWLPYVHDCPLSRLVSWALAWALHGQARRMVNARLATITTIVGGARLGEETQSHFACLGIVTAHGP